MGHAILDVTLKQGDPPGVNAGGNSPIPVGHHRHSSSRSQLPILRTASCPHRAFRVERHTVEFVASVSDWPGALEPSESRQRVVWRGWPGGTQTRGVKDGRVLTVRQPWAWAIIHGGKDVENRKLENLISRALVDSRRSWADEGRIRSRGAIGRQGSTGSRPARPGIHHRRCRPGGVRGRCRIALGRPGRLALAAPEPPSDRTCLSLRRTTEFVATARRPALVRRRRRGSDGRTRGPRALLTARHGRRLRRRRVRRAASADAVARRRASPRRTWRTDALSASQPGLCATLSMPLPAHVCASGARHGPGDRVSPRSERPRVGLSPTHPSQQT